MGSKALTVARPGLPIGKRPVRWPRGISRSRNTGVDVETVRYYEKQGLLRAPPRKDNGYRDYDASHMERLAFIRHCRALNMPLADVARLLSFLDDPVRNCADVDVLVAEQLARTRARLKSMRALEKQLLQLEARCASKHEGESCAILGDLVAAAHGEACACHTPGQR